MTCRTHPTAVLQNYTCTSVAHVTFTFVYALLSCTAASAMITTVCRTHSTTVVQGDICMFLARALLHCTALLLLLQWPLWHAGPIQYDAAVDPEIARQKVKEHSEVAGQANVCIFPDLNTGNNTYKVSLSTSLAHSSSIFQPLQ